MSTSSIVYGGQDDTKYVTFEQLLHAAFMADKIWGDKLEPASSCQSPNVHYISGQSCVRGQVCHTPTSNFRYNEKRFFSCERAQKSRGKKKK